MASWLIPLCLALAGVAVYLNTLPNAFVFDDTPWIVENPRIRSLANLGDILTATNRPVLELTLALNYALGGEEPAGYHALNVAIHVLAGLVLFGLVRRTLLLPGYAQRFRDSAAWLGGAVSLLWLVHPLNTQSVTYTIQRGESLMGLCYLFTLYAVMRYSWGDGIRWALGAVMACWLGIGAKEVIATAPLVVLLYDRTFLARSWRELITRRWGIYLGLFAMWVPLAVFLTRGLGGEDASAGFALEDKLLSRWTYLMTQAQVIVEVYLFKSFWPQPLVLDYAWVPAIPQDTPPGEVARLFLTNVLAQGLIVVGLLLASIWGVIRRAWWGFLGLSFFLILAPTSSFVPIADIAVEHRMYLPLIAVVALVVLGSYTALQRINVIVKVLAAIILCNGIAIGIAAIAHLTQEMPHWIWYALILIASMSCISAVVMWRPDTTTKVRSLVGLGWVALIAMTLGTQTALRNIEYSSRISIWESVVVARPYNARGWHNLGSALDDEGRHEEAMACYEQVLQIVPNYTAAHFGMGGIWLSKGEFDLAIEHFQTAIAQNPKDASYHAHLGKALLLALRLDEAEAPLRRAIELDKTYGRSYEYLGLLLLARKDAEGAIAQFRAGMEADPKLSSNYQNLAAALASVGRYAEAVEVCDLAIRRAKDMKLTAEEISGFMERRDRYRAQAGQAPAGR